MRLDITSSIASQAGAIALMGHARFRSEIVDFQTFFSKMGGLYRSSHTRAATQGQLFTRTDDRPGTNDSNANHNGGRTHERIHNSDSRQYMIVLGVEMLLFRIM
jgi:hypothetical protein